MNPLRKQFNADPAFPFSITYHDRKNYKTELPDHLHDWYELVYVHSGKGVFFIDQTIYDMRAGDLFVIPGNTIHRSFPDRDQPVTSTAVFFSPVLVQPSSLGESFSYLRCFETGRSRKSFKLDCPDRLKASIEELLAQIDAELKATKPGYRHAVMLIVQQLLLQINRETAAHSRSGESSDVGPGWMKSLLLYIDEHYCEPIGLTDLAVQASVSPAHLSRLFKQLTGMNVTGYIAAKRMTKAKELLLQTDDNVGTIASACGFESMTHFHRSFKRIVGTTPAAYRRGASG